LDIKRVKAHRWLLCNSDGQPLSYAHVPLALTATLSAPDYDLTPRWRTLKLQETVYPRPPPRGGGGAGALQPVSGGVDAFVLQITENPGKKFQEAWCAGGTCL
jgi:hypothetical protein